MVEKITSYSDAAGTTPANEVQNVCNSFAQVVTQYQEHGGAVNTGTSPKVEYAYADGSNNTIRPTSMTYPNGRVLQYLYDDTAADKLSRIRTLKWDGTDVCQYSYLGLGTFVITDYLEPEVKLDYALGSGANPYTGFDQFGRIIDLLWEKYGASSSSSSSSSGGPGNALVHLLYGYDQASNRTYREDLVAQAYDKGFDELYEYDGMQRLKKFHRGRLTEDKQTIIDPTLQQGWHLDATGNWQNFTQDDQADASQTIDQQRVANQVNEITQIARTVGANWATPEYDRNGNMTVIPQPKDMTLTYQGTWDAWNRLVKLEEPDGIGGWRNLAEYQYDGQTRRIVAETFLNGISESICFNLHDAHWHDIETSQALNSIPHVQRFWGLRNAGDLFKVDSLETMPASRYIAADCTGSDCAEISVGSTTTVRFAFTPYGYPVGLTNTYEPADEYSPKFWASLRYEEGTALYHSHFRKFHFQLGIWASRDPMRFSDSPNLFQYGRGNPIRFSDLAGMSSDDLTNSAACSCQDAMQQFLADAPLEFADLHGLLGKCNVHMYCARNCEPVGGMAFMFAGYVHICMPEWIASRQQYFGLFIHELFHAKQYIDKFKALCQKTPWNPKIAPVLPPLADTKCKQCKDVERPAYTAQARYLFPIPEGATPGEKVTLAKLQNRFVNAGICQSCRHACDFKPADCPEMPEFLIVLPPVLPIVLPPPGPEPILSIIEVGIGDIDISPVELELFPSVLQK